MISRCLTAARRFRLHAAGRQLCPASAVLLVALAAVQWRTAENVVYSAENRRVPNVVLILVDDKYELFGRRRKNFAETIAKIHLLAYDRVLTITQN